jgi:O-antigen/teichoic acid export membrane protein
LHHPEGKRALLRRFGSGIAWNTVGALFGQGSTFLAGLIVANMLGRDAFGEYSVVRTLLMSVAGASEFALGFTCNRYVSELRITDPERVGRIIGLAVFASLATGLAGTAVLFWGSKAVATYFLGNQQFSADLAFCALFVLFSVMAGLQNSILSGLNQFNWIARLSAIHAVLFIAASVTGIAWAGVPGALIALVLAAILRFLLWGWAMRSILRESAIAIRFRESWSQRTVLFRYTLPSAIAGIFVYAVPSFCAAILLLNTTGFGEVALYNAAMSIKVLVLLLPNLIYSVGISMLNSQLGPRNFAGYRHIFWNNLALTTGVAISAMAAVALFGPWILLAYGSGFADGYKLLLAVVASAAPESIALGLYQVIQSDQRMWRLLFRFQIPRDVAIVLLSFLLAPRYGAFGLALAYGLTWSAALVSLVLLARESPLLSDDSSASQHS